MSDNRNALGTAGARRSLYAIAFLLLAVLPWLQPNGFGVHLAQTFCYTAIAVIGLNMLLGLSGQMSLGQAGFYAIGAYASALASTRLGWPLGFSILFGMLMSAVVGVLVGAFALRTRGLYLAMTTLAVGFIVNILAQRWVNLTGGTMGISGVPQIDFGDPAHGAVWFLYVAGACLLVVQIASDYVFDSRLGRRLLATRDSEAFAASVGIPVPVMRAAVFSVSAALAGLAGALFAHQSGFVGSDAFTISLSLTLLIAAVIGGLASRSGALIGTAILLAIVELIAGLEKYGLMVYGGIMLVVLLAFPRGASGIIGSVSKRWRSRRPISGRTVGDGLAADIVANARFHLDGCALSVESVTKKYGGVVAVDSVSFSVEAGRIHGLIGPNGAGKSTLVNLIAGNYLADGGQVRLDGVDVSAMTTAQRASRGLARTFQNIQLIDALPVLDNVMLGIRPTDTLLTNFLSWWRGRDFDAEARAEAVNIMAFFGIEHLAFSLPSELSYGHRKLVELARAIAQRPRLMLLDEPIAGLNATEAVEVAKVIQRLKAAGATILLIEHNMEFVMSLCDTISVLEYGRLIGEGTPAQVRANERVLKAYLGTEETVAC